jgi:Fur family transcriptional regulator, zinc uptake regulator
MAAKPKLGRNEALVLESLRGAAGAPRTAYQLLEELRPEGLKAPLQIYRALKSLSERHLVHRLESLNAYLACSCGHGEGGPTESQALVFAICDDCGTVREFADPALGEHVRALAEASRFAPRFAATEIHGVCADCRAG